MYREVMSTSRWLFSWHLKSWTLVQCLGVHSNIIYLHCPFSERITVRPNKQWSLYQVITIQLSKQINIENKNKNKNLKGTFLEVVAY